MNRNSVMMLAFFLLAVLVWIDPDAAKTQACILLYAEVC